MKWFKKIKTKVKKVFNLIDKVNDVLVPLASSIVQVFKKIVESDHFDDYVHGVKMLVPDSIASDELIQTVADKSKKIIPAIALRLGIVQNFNGLTTDEEKFQAVVDAFKLSFVSEEQKQRFYSEVAQDLTYIFADGKVTWGESGYLVEKHYQENLKFDTDGTT